MRILFDSQQKYHKNPFGCVTPRQACRLNIHIPATVKTVAVCCVIQNEDGSPLKETPLSLTETRGVYQIWGGDITLDTEGLYFYYFRITGATGTFRLFKQGHDTNMESGDLWQLSCIPADFTTPNWAKGAVIYQVFPDRFSKAGTCDLTGKLEPYILHQNWEEEVIWEADENGEILNNDFYGGNFQGITEKMDYIASLGTTLLYLNPISKSFSSHRYDTADYKQPDPMLGTEADFTALCQAAHRRGIRVILDGVFSHTGANSIYFDREGHFGKQGAYQNPNSPYIRWFTFYDYPDRYHCWWDFDTLPTVNKQDPHFIDYIITNADSVIAHWLNLGADGFRLDVADELPDEFLLLLKTRLRQIRPDALLIGEVWEDASNKIAYNIRRRYFIDGVLDSVMNYPFRTAILNLLQGKDDGRQFRQQVMTILENYPAQVVSCNMNLLGTHDTPRILTALVDSASGSREELARRHLSENQKALAKEKLRIASFLQYMLPGSPSLYYGDEAGMEGHKDPFNRRTYPWGKEDQDLLRHYMALGQLRKNCPALRLGELEFFRSEGGQIGFIRKDETQTLRIYVNLSEKPWEISGRNVLLGQNYTSLSPKWLSVLPMGFCITEDA